MNLRLLSELTKTNFVPIYHFCDKLPSTTGRKSLYCLHRIGYSKHEPRFEYGALSWTEFTIIDTRYVFTSKTKFKNFMGRFKEWKEQRKRLDRIHKEAEARKKHHHF